MKETKAIIQPFMLAQVCDRLRDFPGLPGITVSEIIGWGKARGERVRDAVHYAGSNFARKTKIKIVVSDELAGPVVGAIEESARTGNVGDGKILVYDVTDVVKIRTGERGEQAIRRARSESTWAKWIARAASPRSRDG